jgi:hypothetical protein
MEANLMAAGDDLGDHAGMMLRDVGGNEKSGGDGEVIEKLQEARDADAGSVFALGHEGAAAREGGVL